MAKKHEPYAPRWLKLDNAGLIYPPSRSRNWAAMFRVAATLDECIDPTALQSALKIVMKRMPSFAYRLRRGVFWYYLERMADAPVIQQDVINPMVPMDLPGNRHFMFRVRYYDRRIAVEVFHALTDGTGAMIFLSTLVAQYLKQKGEQNIAAGGMVLNAKDRVSDAELQDSFLQYARSARSSRLERAAYRIVGTPAKRHRIIITTGTMSAKDVLEKAKAYGVTVTTLFAAVLLETLLQKQKSDPSKKMRKRPVKVSIPVNLRPFYNSVTLRNFASYINVGVEGAWGDYSFEELLSRVKHQLGLELTEKGLNARFSANVWDEYNPVIRGLPLMIKAPFMKFMYRWQGDRYCTMTMSNLGMVRLPESVACHIERLDFLLGAASGNPVNCAVATIGDTVSINFTRTITESSIEQGFFTRLIKLGIPVVIQSNRR